MKHLPVFFLLVAAVACAPIAREDAGGPVRTTVAGEIHISAVGDVMLDASARPTMDERGYDYAFENVREIFGSSDIVIGNLEGPLAYGGVPEPNKSFLFRSPPDRVAPALKRAGFNVLNLANNHSLDYGVDGLSETLGALHATGIAYSGAGMKLVEARRAAIVTVDGMRIAFVGYSMTLPETFYATPEKAGTAYGHAAQVRADIADARRDADAVIASFHWGQEGSTGLRDYQLMLAHTAIDAGAIAVLGHHPHVLQAVEKYRDGVIFYSLGNFAFGSFSPRATRSAIARLTLRGARLAEVRLIPLNVNNFEVYFQPQLLAGSEADEVVSTLQELSAARGTTLQNDSGVAVISFE